jgi:hypothetical protein
MEPLLKQHLVSCTAEVRASDAFKPRIGARFRHLLANVRAPNTFSYCRRGENLMKAAKAIHGDDEVAAHRWHQKIRRRLRDEPSGTDSAIRSMRRLRTSLRTGSRRRKVVDNAINYFSLHRDRMCYPDFVAMGLPIGSGAVESAAKNIVQARLKRSGMRWSRRGGQHVLDLRTYLKSSRWDSMWNVLTRTA